jgi:hypothetical protein
MLVDGIDAEFWGLSERSATVFRPASSEGDYEECMELIEANGWLTNYNLLHPIIMAEREADGLVGMIGTRQTELGHLMAGPMAILPGLKRPLLAFRLLQQYESAMISLGHSYVAFDVDRGGAMERAVRKAMPWLKPYYRTESVAWYVWDFGHIGNMEDAA